MAERQGHPWIAGLAGLVTLEAVAFGGLLIFMLRAEGPFIGIEFSTLGAAIGGAVLFLALLGGGWCTWRVWSGHWGLREPGSRVIAPRAAVPALAVDPPAAPSAPRKEAAAVEEAPPAPVAGEPELPLVAAPPVAAPAEAPVALIIEEPASPKGEGPFPSQAEEPPVPRPEEAPPAPPAG